MKPRRGNKISTTKKDKARERWEAKMIKHLKRKEKRENI